MNNTIWVSIAGKQRQIRIKTADFPDISFEIPAKPEPLEVNEFRRKVAQVAKDRQAATTLFLEGSTLSSDTRRVRENIGNYLALELMYTFPEREEKGETTASDKRWGTTLLNVMAIRNRRKIVRAMIQQLVKEIGASIKPVQLASIGCGSGRPVLEALASLNGVVPYRLHLLDLSKDALEFVKSLAKGLGVEDFETILGSSPNLLRREKRADKVTYKPTVHIAEMVGLLDYFLPMTAVKLLRTTRRAILPGGYLLTCNIVPNDEMDFVTNGIGWEMFYRTPAELAKIIYESGFPAENITLIREPLGIHCLALCKVPEGAVDEHDA